MSESIKVVSFNIEYCASVTRGYWQYIEFLWKYFIPHKINAIYEITDVISDEKIDVVLLTEMEGKSRRTHHRDYIKIISQVTPLKNSIFYSVNRMWFNIGNRGNAIATKFDIIESKNVLLEGGFEKRYLTVFKTKIDNDVVTVLSTQLSLGKRSRTKELKQVVKMINSISGPIIFAGDLNTQNEAELSAFKNTRLLRIDTTNTFPSWKPNRRIDYIFHSPEFEVVESYVLDKLKVSDHLPVVAELKLKHSR